MAYSRFAGLFLILYSL